MAHMRFVCLLLKAPFWSRSTKAECFPLRKQQDGHPGQPCCTSPAPDGMSSPEGDMVLWEGKSPSPWRISLERPKEMTCIPWNARKNGGQQKSNSKLSC